MIVFTNVVCVFVNSQKKGNIMFYCELITRVKLAPVIATLIITQFII